jgi:hypothetical protein
MMPFFFMISRLRGLISGVKVTPSMVNRISCSIRYWMRRYFFSCHCAIDCRNLVRSVFSLQDYFPSPSSAMACSAWYFSILFMRVVGVGRQERYSSSASVLKRSCMDCLRCLTAVPLKAPVVLVMARISPSRLGSLL